LKRIFIWFRNTVKKKKQEIETKATKTFPPDEIIIIKQNKMKPMQFELQDQTEHIVIWKGTRTEI
jgi:hypothetical protein